jgi:SAM-dependent methyltransferase
MRLVQSDAAALPLADESVDCILSLRFFHLIPNERRMPFAAEFARAIKPGGHLICSFTNGWYAGGLNWLRKAAGRNSLFFLQRKEITRLFPGFVVRNVRGTFLPLQFWTSYFGPRVEKTSFALTSVYPLNRICWERFYLLQKRH